MQTQQSHSSSRAMQPLLSAEELSALLLDELPEIVDQEVFAGRSPCAGIAAAAVNDGHSA